MEFQTHKEINYIKLCMVFSSKLFVCDAHYSVLCICGFFNTVLLISNKLNHMLYFITQKKSKLNYFATLKSLLRCNLCTKIYDVNFNYECCSSEVVCRDCVIHGQ